MHARNPYRHKALVTCITRSHSNYASSWIDILPFSAQILDGGKHPSSDHVAFDLGKLQFDGGSAREIRSG